MTSERPREIDQAVLWVWTFFGVGLASGFLAYFAIQNFLGTSPILSGGLAVLAGALAGVLSAQIRIVRAVVGRLIEGLVT